MRESQAELREIHDTLRLISQPAARTVQPQPTQLRKQTQVAGVAPKRPSNVTRLDTHPAWQPIEQPSELMPTAISPNGKLNQPQYPSQSRAAQNRATQNHTQPRPPAAPKSIDLPPLQPRVASPQVTRPQAQIQNLSMSDEPSWDGHSDWQAYPTYRTPAAETSARLQERSTQHLQQLAQSVWESPAQQIDAAMRQLEAQAQHVNQLAATQEAALLELKAIAKQIEHEWKNWELASIAQGGSTPTLCDYGQTAVPQVERDNRGVLMVSARSIDWFKSEREAESIAQALRHRATQDARKSKPASSLSRWLFGSDSQAASKPIAPPRRKPRPFSLREGTTLMVGAMAVRVLLNLLVATHPILQIPAIAVMLAPGAIALYRSTVTPKSMLLWGKRLIFIMLGFWLAGRLFL